MPGSPTSPGTGSKTSFRSGHPDVLDLRHVTARGFGGLVRTDPVLTRMQVGGIPVPPVVRWCDCFERTVPLGRLVQLVSQRSDVHLSPAIPGREAGSSLPAA